MSVPRVLYMGNSLDVGGSEVLALEIFRRLHPARFEIEAICLKAPGTLAGEYERSGIRVESGVLRSTYDWLGPARLVRILSGRRFDLVLVEPGRNALLLAALARALTRARATLSWIHSTGKWGRVRAFNRIERRCLQRLEAVVVVAERQRRWLVEREGLHAGNLRLIPNGVDLGRFRPRPELRSAARERLGLGAADFVMGIVGSLTPEKAHTVLIDAVARLRAEGMPVRLVVVGEGGERDAIETAIAAAGLADRVHLLGLRRDLAEAIYPALDLQVLASRPIRETLPVAILEGMASGLPVVATRVGSLEELVIDGTTGALVAPGDAGALAAAIRALMLDATRRDAFGRAARERVERHFALDRMVGAYAALFEELASGR